MRTSQGPSIPCALIAGRQICAVFAVTVICLIPLSVTAQDPPNADNWTAPRTPDGRPDLQGRWTMATFTPLERPDRFADQEFLTEEEAAALQEQLTAEGVDPLRHDAFSIEDPEVREKAVYQVNRRGPGGKGYVHYDNNMWLREERAKGLSSRRTSLIVDPTDGKLPSLTADAQKRHGQLPAGRNTDSYEGRTLSERCIVWPHEGPPMLPPSYNDILQIFQTPDYVVIFQEMSNNNPRIVPMDGRPHLPESIRLWPGDSRGHWQGDTLVVETTNFPQEAEYHRNFRFRGSSEALRVVEQFTRVDADRIHYEFTVEDPTSWANAWTAEVPMIRTDKMMFEYACHEGNHGIPNILSIARNLERQAAEETALGTRSK